MDRIVNFRRPQLDAHETKLSTSSKIFFLLNIVQVFTIGTLQSMMMVVGDYSDISNEGMGPGRRVYMALFTGAIVYTCFLCLFAVRNENYLEVIAFVFQNYSYLVYSFIQVYHINYKTYHKIKFHTPKSMLVLSIVNCILLIVLNIGFTYLAFKLFVEYGWKIYKRVRFNIKLRAAYHTYELVICLMKMTVLFLTMFSICYNLTILQDLPTDPNFIIFIAVIPFAIITFIVAVIALHRESKIFMFVVLIILLIALGGYSYQLYSVVTLSCSGCKKKFGQLIDIPEELMTHLIYLGSVAILFVLLLTLAIIKATLNFNMGLRAHFAGLSKNSTVLIFGISREIVSTLIWNTSFNKSGVFDHELDVTRDEESSDSSTTVRTHASTINDDQDKQDDVTLDETYVNVTFQDDVFTDDDVDTESIDRTNLESPVRKSSTIPARLPTEQRPSVIERLSKHATERLNKLYFRQNDDFLETSCGCCFFKKRRKSDAYVPPSYLYTVYGDNILRNQNIQQMHSTSNDKQNGINDCKTSPNRTDVNKSPLSSHVNRSPNNAHINKSPNSTHVNRSPYNTYVNQSSNINHVNISPNNNHVNRLSNSTYVNRSPNNTSANRSPNSRPLQYDVILEEKEELSSESSNEISESSTKSSTKADVDITRKNSDDLFIPFRNYGNNERTSKDTKGFSFLPLTSLTSYMSSGSSMTEMLDIGDELVMKNLTLDAISEDNVFEN